MRIIGIMEVRAVFIVKEIDNDGNLMTMIMPINVMMITVLEFILIVTQNPSNTGHFSRNCVM